MAEAAEPQKLKLEPTPAQPTSNSFPSSIEHSSSFSSKTGFIARALQTKKLLGRQRQTLVQRASRLYGNHKTGRLLHQATIQRDYVPSASRQAFEEEVKASQWQSAYQHLNGLNMYEMLRALDTLRNAGLLAEFWQQRQAYQASLNLPRIEYAYMGNRKLCNLEVVAFPPD